MKKVTYSLFCDESGTFNNADINVICPMVVVNKTPQFFSLIEGLWEFISPDIPFRRFHAVRLRTPKEREQYKSVVKGIFTRILETEDVYASYVMHRSHGSYGFDFYLGMVLHLIVWEIDRILKNETVGLTRKSARKKQILIQVYLAERTAFNSRYFEQHIHNIARRKVRSYLKSKNLGPDQISFVVKFFVYPIAENPCLVVSDALCHTIRAYHNNSGAVSRGIATQIDKLACLKIKRSQLDTPDIRDLSERLKSIREIEKRTEAEILYAAVENAASKNRSIDSDTIERIIAGMIDQPAWYRTANFDQLYEEARQQIREKRDYQVGENLVSVLLGLLQWERKYQSGEISEQNIDEKEVKIADLHLTVNNHKGLNLTNDSRVVRARELSEKIQYDPSTWGAICSFDNHLAVALQNVFHFQEAIDNHGPRVDYLQRETKNPFIGGGLKAREIGALFGTQAQSLAFNAHCLFFKEGNQALKRLEDAQLYSMMAEEQFERKTDKSQQVVYRAHMKMQQFILAGTDGSLNAAAKLLKIDNGIDAAVTDFIQLFPAKSTVIPAYRVAALMKLACLDKKEPRWLESITDTLLKNKGRIPPLHPMEQIILYAIMLCTDESIRLALADLVTSIRFPKTIINTIKQVLMLQAIYASGRVLTAKGIDAVNDSIPADILPQWTAYGLDHVLRCYKEPETIDRWHIGPIEVLPFNYS